MRTWKQVQKVRLLENTWNFLRALIYLNVWGWELGQPPLRCLLKQHQRPSHSLSHSCHLHYFLSARPDLFFVLALLIPELLLIYSYFFICLSDSFNLNVNSVSAECNLFTAGLLHLEPHPTSVLAFIVLIFMTQVDNIFHYLILEPWTNHWILLGFRLFLISRSRALDYVISLIFQIQMSSCY